MARVLSAGRSTLDAVEGPAANEEDVARVDLDELLLGVLAPALGRNVHHRPFEDLQQRLLHASPETSRVIDGLSLLRAILSISSMKTMPRSCLLDVVVGHLQQPREDALDILTDVSRLGEHRGVDDRERGPSAVWRSCAPSGSCPFPVGPTSTMFDLSISTSSPFGA